MSRFSVKPWRSLVAAAILGAFVSNGYAGAFQVWEESAAGTGDYHAGGAAEADDASTEFYNPAGMTRLTQPQVSFGVAYIPLDVSYNGNVYTSTYKAFLPFSDFIPDPIPTTNGYVSGSTKNWVPNFHFVYPVNNTVALGFGVTAPFGLKTDYPQIDPIDQAATLTKLYTINYNPNIAFQINQYLSLGFGFDALYGTANYNQAVGDSTGSLTNDLSDWGYGWNIGALYQFTPSTRVGVSYRSEIVFNGKGTSTLALAGLPAVTNNNLMATLNLPATTTFSWYSDITQKWALLATAYYTQWNVFQSVDLQNLAGGLPDVDDVMNYKNSWNLVFGTHYKITRQWMLKWAIAWDQTPTQLGYRDIRLPDADRYVAALGVHWQITPRTGWDLGYAHLFTFGNVNVDNTLSAAADSLVTTEQGIANTDTNVIGTQLTFNL